MTKANPKENDVKAEIKKLLDEFGWHHWPASAGGFTTGGVSDRLAVRGRPGRGCVFLAIEAKLKAPKGSALQEKFLQDCRDQGAIGVVVNQERLPKLRQLLEAIDAALFPRPSIRYWHHPESSSLFTTVNGEEGVSEAGDGALVEELDAELYGWWQRFYGSPAETLRETGGPPTHKVFGDFGWTGSLRQSETATPGAGVAALMPRSNEAPSRPARNRRRSV